MVLFMGLAGEKLKCSQTKPYLVSIVVLKLSEKTPPRINICYNFLALLDCELLALQQTNKTGLAGPKTVSERVKGICL
jgi:hypothetical protein